MEYLTDHMPTTVGRAPQGSPEDMVLMAMKGEEPALAIKISERVGLRPYAVRNILAKLLNDGLVTKLLYHGAPYWAAGDYNGK